MKKFMIFILLCGSIIYFTACSKMQEIEREEILNTSVHPDLSDIESGELEEELDQPSDANKMIVADITPNRSMEIVEHKALNEETVGWLVVPGTDIDDVIVHRPEARNDFYDRHDFYGNPSRDGCYFADYRCEFGDGTRSQLSRNTILYGHSWSDDPDGGTAFAQIKRYRDFEFAQNHPYIFFATASETIAWEVFAVFDAHVDFPYIIQEPVGYPVDTLLNDIRSGSYYNYDIDVTPDDKVLTLTCCVFNVAGHQNMGSPNKYRFVVMAKMVDSQDLLKETANISINPSPLPPDTFA